MEMINLGLDFQKLRDEYKEKKYISIDNFLNKDVAEIVYSGLKSISNNGLWYQAVSGNQKYYNKELDYEQSLSAHFGYRYEMFPLINNSIQTMIKGNIRRNDMHKLVKIADNPEMELPHSHPLRKIGYFLNSPQMHNLIAFITSNSLTYEKLHCFASRYTSHDFLATHNDRDHSPYITRKVAFILNFTKDWLVHWGGNLVILNDNGEQIKDAYIPTFNNLVLFDVPLKHAVLPVSVHCQSERFAITGWYHKQISEPK